DFFAPSVSIKFLQLLECFPVEIETGPFNIFVTWHPPDGGLASQGPTARTVHDPPEHSHVLAESWPHELTLLVLSKPINMKNSGSHGKSGLHFDQVSKIVAHVIPTKREHGHRIAANFPHCSSGSSSRFRPHGCSDVHAGTPIEGLKDERHSRTAATSEDKGANWDTVGILPRRIDRGTLRGWRCETGIRMRRFGTGLFGNLRGPLFSPPI